MNYGIAPRFHYIFYHKFTLSLVQAISKVQDYTYGLLRRELNLKNNTVEQKTSSHRALTGIKRPTGKGTCNLLS